MPVMQGPQTTLSRIVYSSRIRAEVKLEHISISAVVPPLCANSDTLDNSAQGGLRSVQDWHPKASRDTYLPVRKVTEKPALKSSEYSLSIAGIAESTPASWSSLQYAPIGRRVGDPLQYDA